MFSCECKGIKLSAQQQLTSSDVAAPRVLGMITFSGILGLDVGDETTPADDTDGVTAAVAGATANVTDLAGISGGRGITRVCQF